MRHSFFAMLALCACASSSPSAVKPADALNSSDSAASTEAATAASDATDSIMATDLSTDSKTNSVADSAADTATASDAGTPCKRGIAYDLASSTDAQVLAPHVHWFYNWAAAPNAKLPMAQVTEEFVPMMWNANFTVSSVENGILPNAKYLLTFNEPNFVEQSDMTPAQAAAAWPNVTANAKGLKIVSPAVNYCDKCVLTYADGGADNSPFDWLNQFLAACPNCEVDYIAFHWYACSLSALQNTVNLYKQFNKPLWLTEFACMDDATAAADATTQMAYMQQAVAYLESEPTIARYAWFTGRWTATNAAVALLGADGQLTSLGQTYVSAPESCSP
jgi:hypothetical protein